MQQVKSMPQKEKGSEETHVKGNNEIAIQMK